MRLAPVINEMEQSLEDSGFPKQSPPATGWRHLGLGAKLKVNRGPTTADSSADPRARSDDLEVGRPTSGLARARLSSIRPRQFYR